MNETFAKKFAGLPIYSLYGKTRKPTPEMLAGLDAVVVDLQDVGARYYTFVWTMALVLEAAAEAGISAVVLDRPNPLGGAVVEGPLLQADHTSFVGYHPGVPIRHGLTIAEIARMVVAENPVCARPKAGFALHTLAMEGWTRDMEFEDTGLPWVLPSPNMPTVDTARVYPGMCLLEACSVSEGRGTTRPFELVGAPWIDPYALKDALDALALPGCLWRPVYFEPTFHKHGHTVCGGVQVHVTDRKAFKPVLATFALLWAMRRQGNTLPPGETYGFDPNAPMKQVFAFKAPPYEYETVKPPFDILSGSALWRELLEKDLPSPYDIEKLWLPGEQEWLERRKKYLLY